MSAVDPPTPAATIRRNDVEWIEIGAAARFSRTKKLVIQASIDAETLDALVENGKVYIRMSAAHRLKRETGALLLVKRRNRVGDTIPPANSRAGPHAARERQDVLPMSSGRSGQGWLGQKPRS